MLLIGTGSAVIHPEPVTYSPYLPPPKSNGQIPLNLRQVPCWSAPVDHPSQSGPLGFHVCLRMVETQLQTPSFLWLPIRVVILMHRRSWLLSRVILGDNLA